MSQCRIRACREDVAGRGYQYCPAHAWREYRRCPCGAIVRGEGKLCSGCSKPARAVTVQTTCIDCGGPAVHSEDTPSICHRCKRGEPVVRRP